MKFGKKNKDLAPSEKIPFMFELIKEEKILASNYVLFNGYHAKGVNVIFDENGKWIKNKLVNRISVNSQYYGNNCEFDIYMIGDDVHSIMEDKGLFVISSPHGDVGDTGNGIDTITRFSRRAEGLLITRLIYRIKYR